MLTYVDFCAGLWGFIQSMNAFLTWKISHTLDTLIIYVLNKLFIEVTRWKDLMMTLLWGVWDIIFKRIEEIMDGLLVMWMAREIFRFTQLKRLVIPIIVSIL